MRGTDSSLSDMRPKQEELVVQHREKTLYTTEVLMSKLNLTMFWQNYKEKYRDRKDKSSVSTNMDELSQMMARNIRLYTIVDQIVKIFGVIKKLEVSIHPEP